MKFQEHPKYGVRVVTPVGVSRWCHLNTPDKKFKKYSVDLVFPPEVAQPLIDKCEEVAKAHLAEEQAYQGKQPKAKQRKAQLTKRRPYKPELDDEGNETGNIIFNFGRKSERKESKDSDKLIQVKMPVVDAKGKPSNAIVFGGSKVSVQAKIKGWSLVSADDPRIMNVGVKLELEGAQIIELVQSSGRLMFGTHEDGYSADAEASDTKAQDSLTYAGDDDDSDVDDL